MFIQVCLLPNFKSFDLVTLMIWTFIRNLKDSDHTQFPAQGLFGNKQWILVDIKYLLFNYEKKYNLSTF